MSLEFSNETTKKGIVQLIDFYCDTNDVSYPIEDKTRDINLALDEAFVDIGFSDNTTQEDDNNFTKLPYIILDLETGVNKYKIDVDEEDSVILDIYKVMVKNQDGVFEEVKEVDSESDEYMDEFFDGRGLEGKPTKFNRIGNMIIFNYLPDYSKTGGVKLFIKREPSYFVSTDTTKKPGFNGLFHAYIPLRVSMKYASIHDLANKDDLARDFFLIQKNMKKFYARRGMFNPHFSGEDVCSV